MRTFLAVIALLLGGCSHQTKQPDVVAALEKLSDSPAKMVLYSLDPYSWDRRRPQSETDFHGYEILGRAEVTDPQEQRALLRALARGASENDDEVAACFHPRHGLQVSQDGPPLDFTICFECLQVKAQGFGPGGFLTSASPQATFDHSLHAHGLRVAPE